jgi:GNAT acetyltransferase-like protein
MSGFAVLPIDDAAHAKQLWQALVDRCPDAWFWHTWANMQFNFVAGQKSEARNLSFFVTLRGEPVGIVPLMVNRTTIGELSGLEASHYGGPLPWPAFVADVPDFERLEEFALTELEARARREGAGRIRLRLEAPTAASNEQSRLRRAVALKYLDSSYLSHWCEISNQTFVNVRERYRRYVRKFLPKYEMTIADCAAVTPELEKTYFQLHVKDAGGQFRSRESYRYQADLARYGEAFYVVAKQRQAGVIAGMLLVSVYKNAAYDNSVAVDPDYQDEYVSHLLKWIAIEELLRRGANSYELGPKAGLPSLTSLPEEKNCGISYFKEGWARDGTRRVVMAEKFLSVEMLQAYVKTQSANLSHYFGIGSSVLA